MWNVINRNAVFLWGKKLRHLHIYYYLKCLKLESGTPHQPQIIRTLLERNLEEHVLFKPQTFSLACSWLKLMWRSTMAHDDDPKHLSKTTKDSKKKKKKEMESSRMAKVKVHILILLRCCGVIWNRLCIQENHQMSHIWKNSALRSGANLSETGRWLQKVSHWSYLSQRGCNELLGGRVS